MSLRSSERGLKSPEDPYSATVTTVAPFVGAWIEMTLIESFPTPNTVAPFVGAWIEMSYLRFMLMMTWVAPFVGAWIEIDMKDMITKNGKVAPFVGAWIEILCQVFNACCRKCRSVRRSVD